MPMSRPIRPADQAVRVRGRAGFSLMEILVVLAILAMATAIIMPSTGRMMDQATSHAVFFEFQKQVSDLRREANRTGVALRVVDPDTAELTPVVTREPDTPGEPVPERVIVLREPWTYTMAPALEIAEGGLCAPASVNLVKEGQVVMTLRSTEPDCRFIRLQ